jgi:arylamine N-acetyltransferase
VLAGLRLSGNDTPQGDISMTAAMQLNIGIPPELRRDVYEQTMERLGFASPVKTTLEGLNQFYKAWCRSIGYDNVLKRIHIEEEHTGPFPVMDPNDFLTQWMRHGTSGSCWPSGEAMRGMLVHCGFEVERVAGQMLECNDPMNPNHGALRVWLDGLEYHVDPGIGAEDALPVIAERETATPSQAYGVWSSGDGHVWWRPGHSRRAIEVVMELRGLSGEFFANRYEMTKEFSLFNTTLYVRRNKDNGILTYGRGNVLRVDPEGVLTAEPIEQGSIPAFLVEQMGLSEEIVARVPLNDVEGAKFD